MGKCQFCLCDYNDGLHCFLVLCDSSSGSSGLRLRCKYDCCAYGLGGSQDHTEQHEELLVGHLERCKLEVSRCREIREAFATIPCAQAVACRFHEDDEQARYARRS